MAPRRGVRLSPSSVAPTAVRRALLVATLSPLLTVTPTGWHPGCYLQPYPFTVCAFRILIAGGDRFA